MDKKMNFNLSQAVDSIQQIIPDVELSSSPPAMPEQCPLCGALPRYSVVIRDTSMTLNTFIVGAVLACPGCGVVHAQAYGEYALIYPTGEVRPVQNAVRQVLDSWNWEVQRWEERLSWRKLNND